MKPKTMILMVVAVACGLVASYMTSRLLAERNTAPADNLVPVVVATKKVAQFVPIKKPEENFEVQMVPDGSPATVRAVKSLAELEGKKLNKTLNTQSIVHTDDLMKKEDSPIEVSKGQRAIAIPVSAKTQVAGFILPGMRVDILCTTRRGDEPTSMILLQNMLVLAVDANSGQQENKGALLGSTVTLAATPEECQRLILAQGQGELWLSLRGPEDKRLETVAPTKNADLTRPLREPSSTVEGTEGSEIAGGVILPPVSKDPAPMATPTPVPEVVKVEQPPEPEEKQGKTHNLTIEEGANRQVFQFKQDAETGEWQAGKPVRISDEEIQPARKPAHKSGPTQAPVQGDKQETK